MLFGEVLQHVEVQDNDGHGDRHREVVHVSFEVACLVYTWVQYTLISTRYKLCVGVVTSSVHGTVFSEYISTHNTMTNRGTMSSPSRDLKDAVMAKRWLYLIEAKLEANNNSAAMVMKKNAWEILGLTWKQFATQYAALTTDQEKLALYRQVDGSNRS